MKPSAAEGQINNKENGKNYKQKQTLHRERLNSTASNYSSASTVNVSDLDNTIDEAVKKYLENADKLLLLDPPQDPIDAQMKSLRERINVNLHLLNSAKSRIQKVTFDQERASLEKLRNTNYGDVLVQTRKQEEMGCDPGIGEMNSIMRETRTLLGRLQEGNTAHDSLMLQIGKQKEETANND